VVLYKTVLGYEIRASGANPRAARTGGVSITKSIVWVGLLSGGLAGLAGWIAVDGQNHILVQGFDSYSWGYQGIAIAALGAFNPIGSLIASIFFSALSFGGESLQRLTGSASVPIELISALQVAIVITFLVVSRWVSGKGFSFWKKVK
jgi:general nucleoside transport system permease protein